MPVAARLNDSHSRTPPRRDARASVGCALAEYRRELHESGKSLADVTVDELVDGVMARIAAPIPRSIVVDGLIAALLIRRSVSRLSAGAAVPGVRRIEPRSHSGPGTRAC